jgi:hypothetical protein
MMMMMMMMTTIASAKVRHKFVAKCMELLMLVLLDHAITNTVTPQIHLVLLCIGS